MNDYSKADLEDMLGVSHTSLFKWAQVSPDNPKYLPFYREENGRPRYKQEDVLTFIQRNPKYLGRLDAYRNAPLDGVVVERRVLRELIRIVMSVAEKDPRHAQMLHNLGSLPA